MKTHLVSFLLLLFLSALPAAARPMVAVTASNQLLFFDSATPATVSPALAITGLAGGDIVEAIDYRPANGGLYALVTNGTSGRICTINTATGAATQVGAAPFSTTLSASFYGFDFDPPADQLRVVNAANKNLRVNPDYGTLIAVDTNIAGGNDQITALAYDKSNRFDSQSGQRTLFGIDYFNDQLVRIGGVNGFPSPNDGAVTSIGSTGISTVSQNIGFDIAENGTAYASMAVSGPVYRFYTINLASGAATLVGNIGSGSTVIRGIAAVPSPVTNTSTGQFFSTIQTAVDAPQTLDGHTIEVNAGTYNEGVTVNKRLTFLGAHPGQPGSDPRRGINESVVRGALVSGKRTSAFRVTVDDVTIDGFTMQEQTHDTQYGAGVVLASGTSGSHIRNNIIQNNTVGLFLANKVASNPTVIEHNLFATNNQSGTSSGAAIYSDQFAAGNTLTSVSIEDNVFSGNNNSAVFLASTMSGSQSNIGIFNNTLIGNGNAVQVFNLTDSFITGNTMTGSGATQVAIGGGVNGLDVSENVIDGGSTRGIRIGDFGGGPTNSNVTLGSNAIINNSAAGLEIIGGTYTGALKAEQNWWGAASGPTIASNPSGTGQSLIDPNAQVDYAPFLASGTDMQPAVTGFQCYPSPILYGINANSNQLIRFDSANPTAVTSIAITGLIASDRIVGLDFHPSTGELFGLGNGSRLYVINPVTGVAVQRGTDGQFGLIGNHFGFDFNPVADRIRVISNTGQNMRLAPDTGVRADVPQNDAGLAYVSGDPNAGLGPMVIGAAYTNDFAGSTRTTLYDIEPHFSTLVRQGGFNGTPSPNGGQLFTAGSLGISVEQGTFEENVSFDIFSPVPGVNVPFAAVTTTGFLSTYLFKVNLVSGVATQVGSSAIGNGTAVSSLTAVPVGSFEFSAPTYSVNENGGVANITINRHGSEGSVSVLFSTSPGTATDDDDYGSAFQIVAFGNGVTSQVIQIPIVNDSLDEPNETVNLALSNPTGGALLGSQNTAVLTIIDDDLAEPVLSTSASSPIALGESITDSATISGGSSPTGTLTFQLFDSSTPSCSGAPLQTFVINVSGNGTYTTAAYTPATPGTYRWVVTYSGDANNFPIASLCGAPTQTFTATQTVLGNIATRLRVGTGEDILIAGFIVTGTQNKRVIVRGIGSSLPLDDRLADPTLELRDSSGALVDANDNWQDSPNKQAIIDSTIPPSDSLESAIVATLPANNASYTAILRGTNGGTGIGVVEAYDLDRLVDSELANISTRGFVSTGDNVLIAGTIVVGKNPQKVIVRAIGPSLPLTAKMADPTLELRDGNGALVDANDNWVESPDKQAIIDSTIPPTNDLESAIVAILNGNNSNYTAIVRGVNGTTGIAVVELYALP